MTATRRLPTWLSDGTAVKPSFQLLKERVENCTPDWVAGITGIPADAIRRLAHDMGVTARDAKIELPIPWTDIWDKHGRTPATLRSVKWLFLLTAFAIPLVLLAAGWHGAPPGLTAAAFVIQYLGLLAERWYFFAQANHPQNLYYQAVA